MTFPTDLVRQPWWVEYLWLVPALAMILLTIMHRDELKTVALVLFVAIVVAGEKGYERISDSGGNVD